MRPFLDRDADRLCGGPQEADDGLLIHVDTLLDLRRDRFERIHLDGARAGATGPGGDGQAVGDDGGADEAASWPDAGLVESGDGRAPTRS